MLQSPAVCIYISETAHPNIRGRLITLDAFQISFGFLVSWIIGHFFTWRIHAFILCIPPILLIFLLLLLPESPYWLIENNSIKLAKKSLQFFRGSKYDISDGYDEILQRREIKKKQHSSHGSWKFTIKQLSSYAFIKPLFGIGIVYALNEWSGFQTLITYTFEIFEETGSIIDPGIILIITASTRVLFAGMGFISIQTQHLNFCQHIYMSETIYYSFLQEWPIISFPNFNQRFYLHWQLC